MLLRVTKMIPISRFSQQHDRARREHLHLRRLPAWRQTGGQRLSKTESGVSQYYITSGPTILAEYANDSGPTAEYIYALGRMVAKFDPGKGHLFYYVDHLNSTRLLDGGTTTLRRDYYPFGNDYYAAGNETAYQFTQKGFLLDTT